MSWTQPLCDRCWDDLYPEKVPARVTPDAAPYEQCCRCGEGTRSGIYARIDPATVPYPQEIR